MSRDFAEITNDAEMIGVEFTKQDVTDIARWDLAARDWGQRVVVSTAHEVFAAVATVGPVGNAPWSLYRRVGDHRLVIEPAGADEQEVVDTIEEAREVITSWFREIAPVGMPMSGEF